MLLLACVVASTVERPQAGDLVAVLRSGDGVAGWALSGQVQRYAGEAIYEYMDGAGEIPRACGFRELAVAGYRHVAGSTVTVEVYQMGSAANAFGLYSLKREPTDKIVSLTHRTRISRGETAFWKGPYTVLLLADRPEQSDEAALLELARAIDRSIPSPGGPPDLLRGFPRDGYVDNSARFFHGKFALDTIWFERQNVLLLDDRTDVAVADYTEPPCQVMIVRYAGGGTARRAREAWAERFRAIPLPGSDALLAEDDGVFMGVVTSGVLLGLVVSAPDRATVVTMTEALRASLAVPSTPWPEA